MLRALLATVIFASSASGQFTDAESDREALPRVPDGFAVTVFAREPLVRQPCSMAFDVRGRLYVGMGPQYRNPKPDTPSDSVAILLDTDSDGEADTKKIFATGFNAVQGLAWHGDALWVANAPDLTVVRDLDGDDQADEYVRLFTDLGNLEHGLHGLNWGPDGKLYMSKGNSKGLNQPGRYAPKAFRELFGMTAPPGTPDFPPPQVYAKHDYQHAYHDPADDWGLYGGVLRCDADGSGLEILSRGYRNPWDIAFDSGFHWIGTDNDQNQGDRVFMPFAGAHFGWNHSWDSEWTDSADAPTAPVSGPLFEGSGTGVTFGDSPHFPERYRRVFFINDWLRKKTFVWRPLWDGALMRPQGGAWEPFIEGGKSLYRPTDIEVGPDGALWVLGWGSGYGAEFEDGKLTNEGRIYRIATPTTPKYKVLPQPPSLERKSFPDLIDDLNSSVSAQRADAQDELVRRGPQVTSELLRSLDASRRQRLSEMQVTWLVWTFARMDLSNSKIDDHLLSVSDLRDSDNVPLNLRIQAIRVLAHRAAARRDDDESGTRVSQTQLLQAVKAAAEDKHPRVRFAAVQAIWEAEDPRHAPILRDVLATESDRVTYYSAWRTLRRLSSTAELKALLPSDLPPRTRRGVLLALLESNELSTDEVAMFKPDPALADVAGRYLTKAGADGPIVKGPPLNQPTIDVTRILDSVSVARDVKALSDHPYHATGTSLVVGMPVYTDRRYRLTRVPKAVAGADLIQTSNEDEHSRGEGWLQFDLALPSTVYVAVDTRIRPPTWVRERFQATKLSLATDDCTLKLYRAEFNAGAVSLGGNTDDGVRGGKSNYVVAIKPHPLPRYDQKPTVEQVLARLEKADVGRGEILFKHPAAGTCAKCHSLDASKNGFGPNLRDVGRRTNAKHIVKSIVDPSAVITEGFNRQVVATNDGKVHSGILLSESGLSLSLGLSTGEQLTIAKGSIERRRTDRISAMPSVADMLDAHQVADITAFLLTCRDETSAPNAVGKTPNADGRFSVAKKADRLVISHHDRPVADFVFRDDQVLRPYLANFHGPRGQLVTRRHPPVEGKDSTDHATMHPGIWFGFGDINGEDFWRNKAKIVHRKFVEPPKVTDTTLSFATQSNLVAADGGAMGEVVDRLRIGEHSHGWLVEWEAEFRATSGQLVFGDQEEMGFGARVATPITEKAGGEIIASTGLRTAAETWGKPAQWCDYTKNIEGQDIGVMLMADPQNFRTSWWHNRNYGVFVANPFGRKAMRQGEASRVIVESGKSLRLRFGAFVHDRAGYNREQVYRSFEGEN